jgi:hypothetical protein
MPQRYKGGRKAAKARDYQKHQSARDAQINEWKSLHPEKVKAYQDKSRKDAKAAAFKKLGGKCSNPACQWLNPDGSRGCTDHRCLQVDHVEGGGNAERKMKRSWDQRALYKRVIEDEEGRYQLLCSNCNWIKRHEHGEHN